MVQIPSLGVCQAWMIEVSPVGDAGEVCLATGDIPFLGEEWATAVG